MYRKRIVSVVTSRQFGYFIRLGYIIRGILYGLVGIGALQLARGITSVTVDTRGEVEWLQNVAHGSVLLIIVGIGIAGYVAWGYIRAGIDILDPQEDVALVSRFGYIVSAVSYSLLALFALQVAFHLDDPVSSSSVNDRLTYVMSLPFGSIMVVVIGILVMGGGLFQLQKAIRANRPIDFLSRQKHPVYSMPFMIFAKTGIAVRAATFVFIGWYIARAGWLLNPQKIHTLKTLLLSIKDAQIGVFVLPVVGVGFLCFACYSILLSWWVDLPEA